MRNNSVILFYLLCLQLIIPSSGSRSRQIFVKLTSHKDYFIVLLLAVTMIVAKIIDMAVIIRECESEIVETISFFLQIILRSRGFPLRIKSGKDRIVFSKNPVNRSNHCV